MDPLSLVRKWVGPYVGESGKDKDDPEVLEAINEARRIVYPLGNWKDIVEPLALRVHDGYVTLPGWAEKINKAWAGAHDVEIENQWYSVVRDGFTSSCGNEATQGLIDLGERFPNFLSYSKNFRIKVVSQDERDRGVSLVFHAISEFGENLLLTRTLDDPWKSITSDPISDKWVKSFSYVEKPVTFDRVRVYIYDPVRGVDMLCAIYEASDINPHFRRYKVPKGCRRTLFAKVKKKFRDLTDDKELVDIHTDALIHVLMAITARRNRSMSEYASNIAGATNFLQREIADDKPTQNNRFRMSRAYSMTNLGFEDEGY